MIKHTLEKVGDQSANPVMFTGSTTYLHEAIVLSALEVIDTTSHNLQVIVIGGVKDTALIMGEELEELGNDFGVKTLYSASGIVFFFSFFFFFIIIIS